MRTAPQANRTQFQVPSGGSSIGGVHAPIVLLGLVALLTIAAPLILGGRHPVGYLAFAAVGVLFGGCWFAQALRGSLEGWRRTGVGFIYALSVLLVVLQLLPLPTDWIRRIAPGIPALLPMWFHPEWKTGLGTWATLSLDPVSTRQALVMLLAYGLIFFATFQLLKSRRDIEQILRIISCAGIFMAILGILQYLWGNGKFLWVYDHPVRDTLDAVKGSFANRNHFAHFLVLSLGSILYQVLQPSGPSKAGIPGRREAARRLCWGAGGGIVLFAVVLSQSRGGILAALIAGATASFYLASCGYVKGRHLGAAGLVIAVIGIALAIHGKQPLLERWQQVRQAKSIAEWSPQRADLWSAHLASLPGSPIAGYGATSHHQLYRTFIQRHYEEDFTHGESGYFPLIMETGILGIGLLLAALVIVFGWIGTVSRDPDNRLLAAAIVPGIVASVVQSIGDFVWYIPACMAMTLLELACLARLASGFAWYTQWMPVGSKSPNITASPRNRSLGVHGLSLSMLLLTTIIGLRFLWAPAMASGSFDEYRRLSQAQKHAKVKERERQDAMRVQLQRVVDLDPSNARAHLQFANLLIDHLHFQRQEAGLLPMPLDTLTMQSQASRPRNEQEHSQRKLLELIYKHTYQAIRLCPLQGEAYASWIDVRGLHESDPNPPERWLAQAARLRPHSGPILFRRGQLAASQGRLDLLERYWSILFRDHASFRNELTQRMWPILPRPLFLSMFKPDADGLRSIVHSLRTMGRQDDAKELIPTFAEALAKAAQSSQPTTRAAELLCEASEECAYAGRVDLAIQYLRQGGQMSELTFPQRLKLADWLEAEKRYQEAAAELEWVARHRPQDTELRQRLIKLKVAGAVRTSPSR